MNDGHAHIMQNKYYYKSKIDVCNNDIWTYCNVNSKSTYLQYVLFRYVIPRGLCRVHVSLAIMTREAPDRRRNHRGLVVNILELPFEHSCRSIHANRRCPLHTGHTPLPAGDARATMSWPGL